METYILNPKSSINLRQLFWTDKNITVVLNVIKNNLLVKLVESYKQLMKCITLALYKTIIHLFQTSNWCRKISFNERPFRKRILLLQSSCLHWSNKYDKMSSDYPCTNLATDFASSLKLENWQCGEILFIFARARTVHSESDKKTRMAEKREFTNVG